MCFSSREQAGILDKVNRIPLLSHVPKGLSLPAELFESPAEISRRLSPPRDRHRRSVVALPATASSLSFRLHTLHAPGAGSWHWRPHYHLPRGTGPRHCETALLTADQALRCRDSV